MIKVVAVDDEPAFVEVLGIYLKEFGDFDIVTYTSPDVALDNIVSEHADAIISDYTMAGMDGISFFKEVKTRIPNIPFLLLTGRDDTRIILDAMNAGIDFLQFKTEDPSILFADIAQKIRSAVDKYRAQQETHIKIKQREVFITIQRDLMTRLSAASTQNQASDACLTFIRDLAGCTRGSIHILNPSTKKIELLIAHNLPDDQLKRFTYGDIHKVLFTGKSQYFTRKKNNGGERITGGQIPIQGGDVVIGVLSFMMDETRDILPDTRDTMEILVSLLGNSIIRIRSEELVRIRQEELNELYLAMEELVIVIDMDGSILNVNPAVTRVLGYEEKELIGEPIHTLYPREIRDTIIFQFLDLTEAGGKIQNTYPFIARNGESVPVETRGTIGVWGGRHVLFCICREISERLKAERNLHEYYERIQAILSSSTAQIYMKDEHLRYLATNQPFIDSLGSEIQSVEGLTDEEIFPDQIAALRREIDEQVLAGDIPAYNVEEELKGVDGTSVWLVTSKVPVHDQAGNVTGIVGTSLDITDLIKTKQELVRRDRILSAVSSLAYFLVRSDDWESLIPEALALLGNATIKDSLFFARIQQTDGTIVCSVLYDWWNKEPVSQVKKQYADASAELVTHWGRDLSLQPAVQGSFHEIPDIGHLYGESSPLSYLLLAIYTSEALWGVIGFIDHHSDQKISSAEVDSLITASGIIGSVLERSQTEELFHRPVERSLVGIYLMQDDHYVYLNPRMSEILGYPRETMEIMPFILPFHQDDSSLVIANHHRILATPDATDDYEIRAITADGQVIFLENLISQFRYHGRPAVIGSIMDITARKESEDNLRQSLHEKDILLREIHHRVKNNMQIIVSLLRMQTSMIGNPEVTSILKESKNRILSMAMVHEKLYRTDNLTSVNLLEYLSSLANTLITDFSVDDAQVTLDLVCDPSIEMTIDAGIPLGLIVNELMTNTFKHGLRENVKGTISIVVMHSDAEWLDITYRDTGKGLPEGFILENCDSLGMQLVQNLIFQASGEMTLGSDNGIVVSLKIPLSEGFIIVEAIDATRE
ncbi:MAG TPA: PAS domain S-box protein [Methanospirillum sp.]|nr:PAS domain S-box protein [Methanospirillum sp.]